METRFAVLGPLTAERDGARLDLGGRRQRMVLATPGYTPPWRKRGW